MGRRIWGEWRSEFYGSGTTIVALREHSRRPHLYIYSDWLDDDDQRQRHRYAMCDQIADYMNGGARPAWLDDFERLDEISARSLSGAQIFATGPCIDKDPPNLFWVQDDSDEAKDNRARLMDALFFQPTDLPAQGASE